MTTQMQTEKSNRKAISFIYLDIKAMINILEVRSDLLSHYTHFGDLSIEA